MPATTARIGFIREPFRRAISENATMRTRHGQDARESDDPVETFFDNVADAQTMADARQTLLAREARRFEVTAKGCDEALALGYVAGTCPTASYADTERDASMNGLIAEFGIDFAKQTQTFVVWG